MNTTTTYSSGGKDVVRAVLAPLERAKVGEETREDVTGSRLNAIIAAIRSTWSGIAHWVRGRVEGMKLKLISAQPQLTR